MADYYPLISRAVAGLEKNTGENRRALYERARAALLAQLRGVTPALSESDITRERLALEESIRKVEAEAARQFVEPVRQPPAPRIRPVEQRPAESRPPESRPSESRASEPRVAEARTPDARVAEPRVETRQWREVEPPSPPPRRYVNPPAPPETRAEPPRRPPEARAEPARKPRVIMPDARQSGSIFDTPLPSPEPAPPPHPAAPPPSRHPLRRPANERRPPPSDGGLRDSGLKDFRNVISEANELGGASARAERSARDAYNAAAPAPTDLDRSPRSYERTAPERSEPRMFEQEVADERMPQSPQEAHPHGDFSEPMLESSFPIDETRPTTARTRRASAADEDDLEPVPRPIRPRRSYRGLIKGLVAAVVLLGVFGTLAWQWSNLVAVYLSFRSSTEAARETAPPAASPKKAQERIEPGAQQTASVPSAGTPQAAVAQKVVLYEEDPDNASGKRFVGSAVWRTETVSPGPGQPPELAVRADIEVPERKLAMTWSFRRNTDKGLPATHTVEIMFKLPSDFPSGGISNVPGILMKQAESTRGVPLAGLAVKVTPGFYLIGLSNLDQDKDRNMQLLKERGWFDIPVVYNNNRRAILAMEKGTPGDRAFAEAFKIWKQ